MMLTFTFTAKKLLFTSIANGIKLFGCTNENLERRFTGWNPPHFGWKLHDAMAIGSTSNGLNFSTHFFVSKKDLNYGKI